MKKLFSIKEALDIAIAGEVEAHKLYIDMAAMVDNPWIRETIEGFAQEELQHRRKLQAVRAGKAVLEGGEAVELGIAETLEDVQPRANMTFPDLLAFAINKEGTSYRLYKRMAEVFSEPELKDLFSKLAKEEAGHRRRFEMQYEDMA